jgi:NADH-ubiquinone oxidoreductase chain 5
MSSALAPLAVASVFVGYLGKDMIIGLGSSFWGAAVTGGGSESAIFIDAEYLPYHVKMIPLVFSHIGIFFAYNTSSFVGSVSKANLKGKFPSVRFAHTNPMLRNPIFHEISPSVHSLA